MNCRATYLAFASSLLLAGIMATVAAAAPSAETTGVGSASLPPSIVSHDAHPAIEPVVKGVDAYPRPSPDGRSIVFVSDRSGNLEIYLEDLDTGAIRQLTDNEAYDNMPVFSPDGRKILFMSDRSGNYDIWEMNADGTSPVNITDDPANDLRPRYSADQRYIVFDSDRDAGPVASGSVKNLDVYVMRLADRDVRRITQWPHWDLYGSFSPDGRKIAFARSYSTEDPERPHGDVFVHDLVTGEETQLTDSLSYVGYTQWSPTGEWIVFASDRHGLVDRSGTQLYDFDIYVVRPDGSDLTRVTHGGGAPESYSRPSFSPDGTKIYANRMLGKREDLVVIDFPGRGSRSKPARN